MATLPAAPVGTVTYLAPREAKDALREATTETLLDAIVQLTHQIHTLDRMAPAPGSEGRLADLRAQRLLARLEVIRRAKRVAR